MIEMAVEIVEVPKKKGKLAPLYSSESVEWGTPQELFDELDSEFHFVLDVCATRSNAKCKRYFTKETDGLKQSWKVERGQAVWCNPPYGKDISNWVRKAFEEWKNGSTIVLLIPVRSDTKYFHDYIYGNAELRFIKGRLRFTNSEGKTLGSAPFPSMIVIFKRR